jgi:hypothetical protein
VAVDFRGHPMFSQGFNAPTRSEADVYDCEVWGGIPTDVEVTIYRLQCDFAYWPPDEPPTVECQVFPNVDNIPYHYLEQ